jgi:fluoroacetyl-CoA thioesterase
MTLPLYPGVAHTERLRVTETLTVPAVSPAFTGFSDMPPVFATAYMIGLMEWACVEAVRPWLEPGEQTVGAHVDVSHLAATPVGLEVVALVELTAVAGRRLRFRVTLWDDADLIGEGWHERTVIDRSRFLSRMAVKAAAGRASLERAPG